MRATFFVFLCCCALTSGAAIDQLKEIWHEFAFNPDHIARPLSHLSAEITYECHLLREKAKFKNANMRAVSGEDDYLSEHVKYAKTIASWLALYEKAIIHLPKDDKERTNRLVKEAADLFGGVHNTVAANLIGSGAKIYSEGALLFIDSVLHESLGDDSAFWKKLDNEWQLIQMMLNAFKEHFQISMHYYFIGECYSMMAKFFPNIMRNHNFFINVEAQLRLAERMSLRLKEKRHVWQSKLDSKKKYDWFALAGQEAAEVNNIITNANIETSQRTGEDIENLINNHKDARNIWKRHYDNTFSIYELQSKTNSLFGNGLINKLIYTLPDHKHIAQKRQKLFPDANALSPTRKKKNKKHSTVTVIHEEDKIERGLLDDTAQCSRFDILNILGKGTREEGDTPSPWSFEILPDIPIEEECDHALKHLYRRHTSYAAAENISSRRNSF